MNRLSSIRLAPYTSRQPARAVALSAAVTALCSPSALALQSSQSPAATNTSGGGANSSVELHLQANSQGGGPTKSATISLRQNFNGVKKLSQLLATVLPSLRVAFLDKKFVLLVGSEEDIHAAEKFINEALNAQLQDAPPPSITHQIYQLRYLSIGDATNALKAIEDLTVQPGMVVSSPTAGITPHITANLSTAGGGAAGGGGAPAALWTGEQAPPAERVIGSPSLTLSGTAATIAQAVTLLDNIDIPPAQVVIDARVFELTPQASDALGVFFNSPLTTIGIREMGSPAISKIPKDQPDISAYPGKILKFGTFSRDIVNFNATIDALVSRQQAHILARPRVLVLDGRDADIFIGDVIKYVASQSFGSGLTTPTITVEDTRIGIELIARPTIHLARRPLILADVQDLDLLVDKFVRQEQEAQTLGAQPGSEILPLLIPALEFRRAQAAAAVAAKSADEAAKIAQEAVKDKDQAKTKAATQDFENAKQAAEVAKRIAETAKSLFEQELKKAGLSLSDLMVDQLEKLLNLAVYKYIFSEDTQKELRLWDKIPSAQRREKQEQAASLLIKVVNDLNRAISNPGLYSLILPALPETFPLGSDAEVLRQRTNRGEPVEAARFNRLLLDAVFAGIQRPLEADSVTMNLRPAVSTLIALNPVPGGGVLPQLRTRLADTVVRLHDGEPFMIGGLISQQEIRSMRKVPLLGDLPFFGNLFRHQRTDSVQNELAIFITPHIQTSPTALFSGGSLKGLYRRISDQSGDLADQTDRLLQKRDPDDGKSQGASTPGSSNR